MSIKKICQKCGVEYERPPSQIGKYCSRVCMGLVYRGKIFSKERNLKLSKTWKNKYKNGYVSPLRGIQVSEKTRHKIRITKIGELNPNWKYKPSYFTIHNWIRRHLIKEKCLYCGATKNLDHANISGKYYRDLLDWKVLCRSCHMKEDGRIKNLRNKKNVNFSTN